MIKLLNLTKQFGPQTAVSQLNLEIPDGQLVGLLGPNGAGKSTTIKMLTGMLLPTSGTAEINGFDVVKDPLNVKRITGYVPETGAVFESLTAWEYLHLVAALYHIPDGDHPSMIGHPEVTVAAIEDAASTVARSGSDVREMLGPGDW